MGLEHIVLRFHPFLSVYVREPDLPVMGLELHAIAHINIIHEQVREPDLPVMGLELPVTEAGRATNAMSESLTCPLWDWNNSHFF